MILVLVEPAGAETSVLSLEALTFARRLAEPLGVPVHALCVGPPVSLDDLAAHGVAEVHEAEEPRLDRYSAAAWAACLVQAARTESAVAVMAAASPRGNEIMAHVAARMGRPMAANVVRAEPGADGELSVHRQVMGGAALEEMLLRGASGAPALFTMAGHAVDAEPAAGDRESPRSQGTSPQVRPFAPALTEADLLAQVVRTEPVAADASDLATARVVVGGGRGVGGSEQFGDLLELVDLLGGALGVSRVVTSLGWRPHHEQVGQTGSRITPDVYLACGISGAIQHWAGCSSAKTIIAINTDPDAPMVTKAHYAVIGDLHEIVPAINAELRARLS
jgi:electron transfer flavoprotein alpha subunit